METTINQVINYISKCDDLNQLVTILELAAHKSGVKTISAMARAEGKSANGVRLSNAYRKIEIGNQLMCVKGLMDTNLPF